MFFCLNVFEAIKFAPKVIHLKGQLPAPYGPTYSWDWKRILFHPPPPSPPLGSAKTSCWQVLWTALLQICSSFGTTCAFLHVYKMANSEITRNPNKNSHKLRWTLLGWDQWLGLGWMWEVCGRWGGWSASTSGGIGRQSNLIQVFQQRVVVVAVANYILLI